MADGKVEIIVDGVPFAVTEGQNLLQACLSHDIEIPYFCWHPALGSVGACRQCAIIQYADEDDQRGRLTMACMTPVTEGVRISVSAEHAGNFRASVIEWLMENHPHDCPVCEEGGECHLQDMTVMTGHTQRRYRGRKRTFENQYLGPFINHEMNRCITCYRCVRFYRDYAGGSDLQAFGSRSRMYFGRARDGVLENEFSGNLIEVCPTGVFTDKPFSASYTRKWDLTSAPSICPGCAVGCNTFVAERYGRLKRVQNRYHGALNGYFLCDRGRFGADFVNSPDRIPQVGERIDQDLFSPLPKEAGLERFARLIRRGLAVGIGSPRASMETNAALRKLVGKDRFCTGMSTSEAEQIDLILSIYRATDARIASISDVEAADTVLILGEDVLNSAPRIALALRQTARNRSFELAVDAGIPQWQDAGVRSHGRDRKTPIFIASVLPTGIDDISSLRRNDTPDGLAATGRLIAAALRGTSSSEDDAAASEFIRLATAALAEAKTPLIISGTGCGSRSLIEAAGAISQSLQALGCSSSLLLVPPEANSLGCGLLGGGLSLDEALDLARRGDLIVAENDLFRRAEPAQVSEVLDTLSNLVVLDSLDTRTASRADLVFPAATFAESSGTFVNLETRAQRFYAALRPAADIAPSWRWLSEAAVLAGRTDMDWTHIDEVSEAAATGRLAGLADAISGASSERKIPRSSHRFSGRTAMYADRNIHEPKTPVDQETPLAWSMEGQLRDQPSDLLPFVWAPGWNSNQAVFKFQQEVGGAASGGDGGIRMITDDAVGTWAPASSKAAYAGPDPAPESAFSLIPVQLIFGSDELSARSPAIAERIPTAFVVLSPADANRLDVAAGGGVRCAALDRTLEVRIEPAMRSGFAALAQGLADLFVVSGQTVELVPDPNYKAPDYRAPGDSTPGNPSNIIARE